MRKVSCFSGFDHKEQGTKTIDLNGRYLKISAMLTAISFFGLPIFGHIFFI
jgi:hypothetical protein